MHGRLTRKLSPYLNSLVRDPLSRNSLYLMTTSILTAGFGYVFWIAAGRLYSPAQIGVAGTLLSLISLSLILSRFGLEQSLLRFFPTGNKNAILGTSLVITTTSCLFFSVIAVIAVELTSGEIGLTKTPSLILLFVGIAGINSIVSVLGVALVSLRKADYYFYQNILTSSKILFLFPLTFLGAFGIIGSVGISLLVASLFSFLYLMRKRIRPGRVDVSFLKESFSFSIGNYLASLSAGGPVLVLPALVLGVLGAESAGEYYVVWLFVMILNVIPSAYGMSLLVEGSHDVKSLRTNTIKSMKMVFLFLLPMIAVLWFLGGFLLELVGDVYVQGLELLRLMILASPFVTVISIYGSIKRVQKRMKVLVLLNGLYSSLVLGLSFLFMVELGIVGLGYASIVSSGVVAGVICVLARMEHWF